MRFSRTAALVCALAVAGGLTACGTEQKEPAPTSVADARDDYHPTVRDATTGLDGHTVFRPADLDTFPDSSVPVLAWANGGCRTSNISTTSFLSGIAAQGYIVIANGAPDEHPIEQLPDDTLARPDRLTDAIDWALGAGSEQFGGKADTEKIGVMGTSCGGVEALLAASDPRVDSVVGLNTGFFPRKRFGYERTELDKIEVPTLLFNGGDKDQAKQNSIDNFELLDAPAVLVTQETAGHSGLTYGLDAGDTSGPMMIAGYTMVTDWFDYTLHASAEAEAQFAGPDCGLCTKPTWTVRAKNL
ncbi:alpha/beta hydrolase [Nocardia speluncae]|uniref:Alpha/beta hydrolase n=1 Tax=Nocardia speluncae TaxID=419477 RepID=A0A846XAL4_9NOCA|nr:alpha/beta hydrolase [Nocardia speluncae]NKY33002.1 alpha/beta hydrolase [Nocardia speluncae]